mgnify:CR=1 FL=1
MILSGAFCERGISYNSDKVQSTNKQVFKTLQDALNDFVNNKKWTDATFAMNERIDCSMTLIINEMVSDNSFKGEIQVQARRPVYNSSYTTTLLNYRDTELSFDYTEFEPLEYTENTLNSNLIATVVFISIRSSDWISTVFLRKVALLSSNRPCRL